MGSASVPLAVIGEPLVVGDNIHISAPVSILLAVSLRRGVDISGLNVTAAKRPSPWDEVRRLTREVGATPKSGGLREAVALKALARQHRAFQTGK